MNPTTIAAMTDRERSRSTTPLARRVGGNSDSLTVAQAFAEIWGEIEASLHPILGRRGLTALFRRSAHVSAPQCAFLAILAEGEMDLVARDELVSVFCSQTADTALDGGSLLLNSFRELLSTLIGAGLTERLLQSVWSSPTSGPSAQDFPR
ncbi:hypothetical protein SNE35_23845 [Paucibacter sp. R3-3]|uniref:Uncharacterized protein n=1 Tax=Roseateles agri TaxID=3098619 RepID=A0ABU5DMN7_9BURK|nr:hypothetical protein [Paucibacter sp. R3-3]MDY0747557.1 hypothetical protein [Paucibacter sp. R3-3]